MMNYLDFERVGTLKLQIIDVDVMEWSKHTNIQTSASLILL